jgi:hypothetical protein
VEIEKRAEFLRNLLNDDSGNIFYEIRNDFI